MERMRNMFEAEMKKEMGEDTHGSRNKYIDGGLIYWDI